jgi:glycosyltransferase involved in cell wall biosynthesis
LLITVPLPIAEDGTTPDPLAILSTAERLGIFTVAVFQLCHKLFGVQDQTKAIAKYLSSRQQWVAVSLENKKHLVSTFDLSETNVQVIPNGICVDKFPFRGFRVGEKANGDLPVYDNARIVTQVGRLVHSKRQVDIIDALPLLPKEVIFLICGSGPTKQLLRERASELNVANRVKFLGDRLDVGRLLEKSDVFAFPSIAEGASFALMEAMAIGCPVVACSSGSNKEIIRDEVDGLLHHPLSAEHIALKIMRVLQDPSAAAHRALSARRRVEECYSYGQMIARTIQALQSGNTPLLRK